jgi:hypothetical protein
MIVDWIRCLVWPMIPLFVIGTMTPGCCQTPNLPESPSQELSSVDGMKVNDPLLVALDTQPISPQVAFHSIVASRSRRLFPSLERNGDGLVSYFSAHLDGAASERVVQASHMCEDDPEVIAEVRRILTLHVCDCPDEAHGLR